MWRPFIVDLWDTRLRRAQPRSTRIELPAEGKPAPPAVETAVRYHLLDETRRERIGCENTEPIAYEVFRRRIEMQRAQ